MKDNSSTYASQYTSMTSWNNAAHKWQRHKTQERNREEIQDQTTWPEIGVMAYLVVSTTVLYVF